MGKPIDMIEAAVFTALPELLRPWTAEFWRKLALTLNEFASDSPESQDTDPVFPSCPGA